MEISRLVVAAPKGRDSVGTRHSNSLVKLRPSSTELLYRLPQTFLGALKNLIGKFGESSISGNGNFALGRNRIITRPDSQLGISIVKFTDRRMASLEIIFTLAKLPQKGRIVDFD